MPYQSQLASVVVESTFNWYWSVDGLQAQRFRVHLANTTATEQYDSLKHRCDESDASHLAHVFRLGLLPTGHIMPKEQRAVRDLARKCMQLVQQRSTHITYTYVYAIGTATIDTYFVYRNANRSTTRRAFVEQSHSEIVL